MDGEAISDDAPVVIQREHAQSPRTAIPERGDAVGVGGTPQTRLGVWWETHPRLVRWVVGFALAWGGAWMFYRMAWSWHGANPFAFAALGVVEGYNWVALCLLAMAGWRWDRAVAPPATSGWNVDVLVCTYDESVEVVEATLAGCAALRYPHATYLLDDGRREEMRILAERWDVVWMTRPDNAHAKAGNINHALGKVDGDLIFFLDADHVPLPDALDLTVGYFDDPTVALVQSPHDFYNQDSVQHYGPGRHEQSLFFEVVCPGKDRVNAVFWCGSATVVRRRPLMDVGGVATETIAEDFHTTIKMHRNGWRTRYHNQVLVQGLAPIDLDGYLLQRDRWARGNLGVFRLPESPLRPSAGLDLRQRLSYFSSLFAYGAGAVRLAMMVLLVVTLVTGTLPARVSLWPLLLIWVPSTILALTATTALCRGHMRLSESSHYTLLTAEIYTRALRCVLFPSRTKFKVTPKSGADPGGWVSVRRLRAVIVIGVALIAALIWRALAIAHVVHARGLPGFALPLAVALAIWELTRLTRTILAVLRRRQQRVVFRFPCRLPAVVAAAEGSITTATVVDISVAGLRLASDDRIEPGTEIRLSTAVSDVNGTFQFISIAALVRSCRADANGAWHIGTETQSMDDESRRRLVTFCHVVHPFRQLRPEAEAIPVEPVPVERPTRTDTHTHVTRMAHPYATSYDAREDTVTEASRDHSLSSPGSY